MAAVKASQPRTSSTEVKRSAIEDASVPSWAEEERTTRGRSAPSRRHASGLVGRPGAARSVAVITKPGRTGRPSAAARARLTALAPAGPRSRAAAAPSGATANATDSIPTAHSSPQRRPLGRRPRVGRPGPPASPLGMPSP